MFIAGCQWMDWSCNTKKERILATTAWGSLWPLLALAIATACSLGYVWRFLNKYLLIEFHYNLLFRPEKYKKTPEQLARIKDDYEKGVKPFITESGTEIWVKANRHRYIFRMVFKINGEDLDNFFNNQNQQQCS